MSFRLLLPPLLVLIGCDSGPRGSAAQPATEPADEATGSVVVTTSAPSDEGGESTGGGASSELTVQTTSGVVVGLENTSGQAFLGIPFAEPPVGDLRFAPPVPVEPWTEPRDASEYGPVCPQPAGLAPTLDGAPQSEDCLSLNVWRPSGASRLPIIVHIHGGSHQAGSGRLSYLDHPTLAEDAVLVTVNYRLGALGFLAHPELSAEDDEGVSGNQAIRDNLLALQWIKDNAEAFGGDPEHILVWGFSAGGSSTCALLESPFGAGLFSAVLVESGQCGVLEPALGTKGDNDADDRGQEFAAESGCDGSDAEQIECLRDLDASEVLDAQEAWTRGFGIVKDGYILPDRGLTLIEEGEFNRVPIYAGNVADELYEDASALGLRDDTALADELEVRALGLGLDDPDGVIDRYSVANYGSIDGALSGFLSDTTYACGTRALLSRAAAWVDTHSWWFDAASPSSHGADLTYWTGDGVYAGTEEAALGASMAEAMVSIAAGAPMVDELGAWPLNGGTSPDTWVLMDPSIRTTTGVDRDNCDWLVAHGLDL